MEKDIFDMDAIATILECSSEKICIMLEDIMSDYFCEPDITKRSILFERNKIKVDIIADYIDKSQKGIDALREKVNKLWDIEKDLLKKKANE